MWYRCVLLLVALACYVYAPQQAEGQCEVGINAGFEYSGREGSETQAGLTLNMYWERRLQHSIPIFRNDSDCFMVIEEVYFHVPLQGGSCEMRWHFWRGMKNNMRPDGGGFYFSGDSLYFALPPGDSVILLDWGLIFPPYFFKNFATYPRNPDCDRMYHLEGGIGVKWTAISEERLVRARPPSCKAADLNCDGRVDFADFLLFAQAFVEDSP